MALVVLRTYAMLSEAQVAAGALRAAGLEPVLLDQAAAPPYSGLTSMGGFRLAVAETQAGEAAEVLRAAVVRPLPDARDDGGEPADLGWEPPAGASREPPASGWLGRLAGAALLLAAAAWAIRRGLGL